ncbi:hypothetical protein GT613_05725 [Eggerthella sp. BIOML-A4]|uniref:hypothetical protein n=1 Tax=Eggerthella sp. BIOML-A4 TaxID=2584641 RepID=UPI0012AF7FA2|nr:hypothetical protein [Eggerthella sp. BIOML-A4]MSA62374.1 hypothetical protein [Gordonibacter pamelaeae]MZK27858.1 hypothetical protein [Eggerthella sp. BIOML-A4]
MTEETAITISDDVRAVFMTFDDDYLADVLRLWDCDLKEWCDPYAMVFRFEKDDVLVWNEGGVLRCRQGAVNLNEAENVLPSSFKSGISEDACLCWTRDDFRHRFIGMVSICRELADSLV